MTDIYNNKEECTGCTACYSICPVNAIKMEQDDEGFFYPVVDQKVCIHCGKCKKVCAQKYLRQESEPIKIYAVKCKNDTIRMNSSSGGSFTMLAEWTERQRGVIYGAAFDDKFQVKHYRAENRSEWKKFCYSKYVQSELEETFKQIKTDLLDGRNVLFTGTPCQVEGVNRYLQGVDTAKLITCDIVCHGVPSPKVWSDYLLYIQRKYRTSIKKVNFRDKSETGWHNSILTISGKKNKTLVKEGQSENVFFQLFFRHLILRPACYRCLYANFNRPGDITLGDCWGIEKNYAQFDDDKGVSLLMCNTKKGNEIWEKVRDGADYFIITKEECLQPNLHQPSSKPLNREEFWSMYKQYGFKRTGKKMKLLPISIMDRIGFKQEKLIRKLIEKIFT